MRFLDHADRRIRRHISTKKKLIMLLEEQKQVIAQQAVTGQIDVRTGKPYRAYKDSGVKRLGRIPAHWEVKRVYDVARIVNGFPRYRLRSVEYRRGLPTDPDSRSYKAQQREVRWAIREGRSVDSGDVLVGMAVTSMLVSGRKRSWTA